MSNSHLITKPHSLFQWFKPINRHGSLWREDEWGSIRFTVIRWGDYSTDIFLQTIQPKRTAIQWNSYLHWCPFRMPLYNLKLEADAIITLIRNISIQNGLCKYTRLMVLAMCQHCIEASLIFSSLGDRRNLITRLKLALWDLQLSFYIGENPWFLSFGYAMTIYKA